MILWRSRRFCCMRGRRRSKYRYLRRLSSPMSWPSPRTSIGGGSGLFMTAMERASSSPSPFGSFLFINFSGLLFTLPVTEITHSGRMAPASSCASLRPGSAIICTFPLSSRRAIKISLPWSRRTSTKPPTGTSPPTRSFKSFVGVLFFIFSIVLLPIFRVLAQFLPKLLLSLFPLPSSVHQVPHVHHLQFLFSFREAAC